VKDPTRPLLRTVPTAALLASLVAAGWLAGRWVLYFMAPAETPQPPARERVRLGEVAQGLANAHLFGMAATPAGSEAVSNLNIKLRGVLGGAAGLAILNTGDRDQTARVGGEIVPGVVLEAVHAGHVVLRRNGVLERVNLEERRSIAAAPAQPRRARSRSAAAPSATPPLPGARSRRPEPYAPVGDQPTEPPPGAPGAAGTGLVVSAIPPGSLLERIGLQPGDVIRSVSGDAVASEADVARIVQRRGLEGAITVEVQRGGITVPLTVKMQR
jgi:general secretion pathway protein C